jgi:ADP-heptose:LPS heptosyltransferase
MNGILVIRPGAIGDALLAFPVLLALRTYFASAHITFVSNTQVLPLALASGVTEEAYDFQDIHWSELFSISGIRTPSIRDLLEQIDLAICWLRDPDGIVEHNLKHAGVKNCVIAPGRPPEGEHIHIVDYLARTVGLSDVWVRLSSLLPLQAVYATSKGTATATEFFAIHPGSGSAQKCWLTSHFASVSERLWQQNKPVLLLAGPADTERAHELLEKLSTPPTPEMFKLLTNAPLLEVAHQLQQCRGYLGNDSGITHLAAMLAVPTIAIFGPTDPAIWRPVGLFVKVLSGHTLEYVTVDAVMEAIDL